MSIKIISDTLMSINDVIFTYSSQAELRYLIENFGS